LGCDSDSSITGIKEGKSKTMPGVFLILRDEHEEKGRVLEITNGGPPHITLAHTGKLLTDDFLIQLGSAALSLSVRTPLKVITARINSWQSEKTGKWRHDVLLDIDNKNMVEVWRTQVFNQMDTSKFNMRDPHVTIGTHEDKTTADDQLRRVSKLLPREVNIVGYFI
jgi:2'-5' RNA ligase